LGIWLLLLETSRLVSRERSQLKLFVFRLGWAYIKRMGLVGWGVDQGRDTCLVMRGQHRCLVLGW